MEEREHVAVDRRRETPSKNVSAEAIDLLRDSRWRVFRMMDISNPRDKLENREVVLMPRIIARRRRTERNADNHND